MTDEQFTIIVNLLESIEQSLSYIESNTGGISSIESNTSDALKLLRNIKRNTD